MRASHFARILGLLCPKNISDLRGLKPRLPEKFARNLFLYYINFGHFAQKIFVLPEKFFSGGGCRPPPAPMARTLMALAALSIPVSNAVVERTFSHVTWVKSKYRNRIGGASRRAIIVLFKSATKNMVCSGKKSDAI